ncbi:response regulator receiver domain-containing protein [Hirsutella rhossiliensis]|uniref:Response regulator receiver domain-containing protein n=1 Tax=Hirsutella rhossiliensis TaxID=111463 RepID=A0A9P8MP85_9HYPO|nr:response regulator receiver domain-containing protein [Hirsutella rhossiliensis]KAH0958907.1 response regulator receiver domain-containing protein [Hirsutella rhossiliensis]
MAPDIASRIRARFMRRRHSEVAPVAPAAASPSLLLRRRSQPGGTAREALVAPPLPGPPPVLVVALDRGLKDAAVSASASTGATAASPAGGPQRLSTAIAIALIFALALVTTHITASIETPAVAASAAAVVGPLLPVLPSSLAAAAVAPSTSAACCSSPVAASTSSCIHEHSVAAAANLTPTDDPHHGHGRDRQLDQLTVVASSAALAAAVDTSDSARRQSTFASRQSSFQNHLYGTPSANDGSNMVTRKVWVKRPHASATTIAIHEDDLVDDVRDLILRKYANSLGRTFDSPDLSIRVCARGQEKDRILGPEETMARMLDRYYPGGQTVDEALIVDIPRRTPKASPMAPPAPGTTAFYLTDEGRPSEAGEGYFPPVVAVPSPHMPHSAPAPINGAVAHSISILGTGHVPPIPSPGGGARSRAHRDRSERPRLVRQHTASPTILPAHPAGPVAANVNHATQHFAPRMPHSRTHSSSSDHQGLPTVKTSKPKSPGPGPEPTPARVATPPPRIASPRSSSARPKKSKKSSEYPAAQTGSMLNGTVPPISVLIVEDNPINLKLLEAFVKRLKVRWQTAMNGRDAVKKWRTGGFHLVLMDIQLPVMNGLDATREIRRLERVNSIGVFSSLPSGMHEDTGVSGELKEQDRLVNPTLFKSPVIIVALTASSLQSDRHEALAAGCNDFLTKPVNFVWLERKVMEWGCMQALIDFDGWRKWKDYGQLAEETEASKKALGKSKRARSSLSSST